MEKRRNMSESIIPPPRNTNGLPLTENQREPAYAFVPGAESQVLTVRTPKLCVSASEAAPLWEVSTLSV